MLSDGIMLMSFSMKNSSLNKRSQSFIKAASLVLYKALILEVGKSMNMAYLKRKGKSFLHHSRALYAKDVKF